MKKGFSCFPELPCPHRGEARIYSTLVDISGCGNSGGRYAICCMTIVRFSNNGNEILQLQHFCKVRIFSADDLFTFSFLCALLSS